jgi:hypothetical protein
VVKVANVIHVATKRPTIDVNPLHLNIYHIDPNDVPHVCFLIMV